MIWFYAELIIYTVAAVVLIAHLGSLTSVLRSSKGSTYFLELQVRPEYKAIYVFGYRGVPVVSRV